MRELWEDWGEESTAYRVLLGEPERNLVLFSPRGGDRGSTAVKVLCYKSEGRWFDPSWCQWIFH